MPLMKSKANAGHYSLPLVRASTQASTTLATAASTTPSRHQAQRSASTPALLRRTPASCARPAPSADALRAFTPAERAASMRNLRSAEDILASRPRSATREAATGSIIGELKSPELAFNPILEASPPEQPSFSSRAKLGRAGSFRREFDVKIRSVDDLVDLKQRFDMMDRDGKGGLDEVEFVEALGNKWTGYGTDKLSRLFMRMDTNCDGNVSYEELVTFLLVTQVDAGATGTSEPHKYAQKPVEAAHSATTSHATPITHLCRMGSEGKYLSVSPDGGMRLWDVASSSAPSRAVPRSAVSAKMATCALYVPTQQRLALSCADGRVHLCESTSLRPDFTFRLREPAQALANIEALPSSMVGEYGSEYGSDRLLIGSQAGTLHVLDWARLTEHDATFAMSTTLHNGWIEKLEWVRDLGGLFSCGADGALLLSDLGRGGCSERNRLRNPTAKPFRSFAWSGSLAAIATCGVERHIQWWSPSLARPVSTLVGHAAAVTELLMDERHNQLISRSEDDVVRVWDVRTHRCVQVLDPPRGHSVTAMLLDDEQNVLLTADRHVRRYQAVLREQDHHQEDASATAGDDASASADSAYYGADDEPDTLVSALCCIDFRLIVSVDSGNTVRLWDLGGGGDVYHFNTQPGSDTGGESIFTAANLDSSGRRLLTGSSDGVVRAWNMSTGRLLHEYLPPTDSKRAKSTQRKADEITAVTVYRDLRQPYIAASGWSREIWIWLDNPKEGATQTACQTVLAGHEGDVLCTAYSAPSALASGAYDGVIIVWNLPSGSVRGRLVGDDGRKSVGGWLRSAPVTHLAFVRVTTVRSSSILVSASADGRLRVWYAPAVLSLLYELQLLAPTPGRGLDQLTVTALSTSAGAGPFLLVAGDSSGRLSLWSGDRIARAAMAAYELRDSNEEAPKLPADSEWKAQRQPISSVHIIAHATLGKTLILTASPRIGSLQLWTKTGSCVGRIGVDRWDLDDESTYRSLSAYSMASATSWALPGPGTAAFLTQADDRRDAAADSPRKDARTTREKVVHSLKARARITLSERAQINSLQSLSDQLCTSTNVYLDGRSADSARIKARRHPPLLTSDVQPLSFLVGRARKSDAEASVSGGLLT